MGWGYRQGLEVDTNILPVLIASSKMNEIRLALLSARSTMSESLVLAPQRTASSISHSDSVVSSETWFVICPNLAEVELNPAFRES